MLWLSEVMMANHQLENFDELVQKIEELSRTGEIHFRMDVKPTYLDTPDDWEDRLETAFSGR